MDTPIEYRPPFIPWSKGWLLSTSAWTQADVSGTEFLFRTLSAPGDLAPADATPAWGLHMGLTDEMRPQATGLIKNGFFIEFQLGTRSHQAVGLLMEPGVLVGYSNHVIFPALFSLTHEIQKTEAEEVLKLPQHFIVLQSHSTRGGTQFCLAVSEESEAQAREKATAGLQNDITAAFRVECERRRGFFQLAESTADEKVIQCHALEKLATHLQAPSGQFGFRWSATAHNAATSNVNDTLALVAAWCRVDVGVARDLVQSALQTQQPDGSIPAVSTLKSAVAPAVPAWPLLAQCVLRVHKTAADEALLEYALPRLHRYLKWAMAYYDPEHNGLCRWGSVEAAFLPDASATACAAADLSALLLAELDAFEQLCQAYPDAEEDTTDLVASRQQLATQLQEQLWDSDAQRFVNRPLDGTLAGLPAGPGEWLPLLWSQLPSTIKTPVVQTALTWEPAPDSEAARHPMLLRTLLWMALEQAASATELESLAAGLRPALAADMRALGLLTPAGTPPTEGWEILHKMSVEQAAVALATARKAEIAEAQWEPVKPWVGKMDRVRRPLVILVVAIVLSALLSVVLLYHQKTSLPSSSLEALNGLAEESYKTGDYKAAIVHFDRMLRLTGNLVIKKKLGDSYFQAGQLQDAERIYRELVSATPPVPSAWLNLGLTLYRQKNFAEATQCYQTFISSFGEQYPALASKADLAIRLIREQSAANGGAQ